jgi:hypothetical protein
MPAATTGAWVDALQAWGRYAPLRADVLRDNGLSVEVGETALRRLAHRKRGAG